ncbi:MAG: ChbG/HpnK family deacetylase [Burkholderiales bacterium]|nr:ChbG/HpnK family deacetylase [Burkholderiales bacterium]
MIPPPPVRNIVVCADDFGLHAGVNAACAALGQRGRLGAVSCLVGGPAWRAGAELEQLAGLAIDVGLHLDFTEYPMHGGAGGSLESLLLRAYSRRLDGSAVAREIHAQLDAFEAVAGRPPDHVDGHRHVHQFPVIRGALVRALAQRYPGRKPWIRCTAPMNAAGTPRLKPMVIAGLGGAALARLALRAGLAHNARLGGVYGFDAAPQRYSALLLAWLRACGNGDVLMCHPARGTTPADGIAAAREVEFGVLASDWFEEQLRAEGVAVARLARHPP